MADTLRDGIVINEILVDPNGAINYDTDGNGTADNIDEFIEINNISDAPIDISGLQLWDAGIGNYFTFPPGTILQPGAHAMVITGISPEGSLPSGGADDLFFSAGRTSAVINNGGDNVVLYDPTADEYVIATFNDVSVDNPANSGYSGFSGTATQVGEGEDFGSDTDGQSLQRTPDGSDNFTSDAPTPGTSNICFTQGTSFQSLNGQILVDHIRAGDWIMTYDHGPQQVRWVYTKTWSVNDMQQMPNFAPVVIAASALGHGRPLHDLRVSQQHRILISGPIAQRMFGAKEVLVAAKHLIALDGVWIDAPTEPVSYFHIMMDRHEVLMADGLPTESLFLGPETLKAIPEDAQRELEQLLGLPITLLAVRAHSPARTFVKGRHARTLVGRHLKNDKPLLPQNLETIHMRSATTRVT